MNAEIIHQKRHRQLGNPMVRTGYIKPYVVVKVEADSLKALFKKTLKSMANTLKSGIYNPTRHSDCTMKIEVNAENTKTLLEKFLGSVLELTHAHHTIFCTMYIDELTEHTLSAQLFGNWFDAFDNTLKSIPEHGVFMSGSPNGPDTFKSSIHFKVD